MLVIMENRDIHLFAQLAFHLETFRRLDVFKVDAAEGGLQRCDGGNHVVDAGRIDFDVEDVDTGEFLEENGLAFHHGLGGERADIAKPENCRAVGNDRDEVGAGGIFRCHFRIFMDGEAGGGDTRRVGKRQIALVAERLGGLDFQLAGARVAVEKERLFLDVGLCRVGGRVVLIVRGHSSTVMSGSIPAP
ncbi:hypothetical protein D3C71_512980 [compost metagenome]